MNRNIVAGQMICKSPRTEKDHATDPTLLLGVSATMAALISFGAICMPLIRGRIFASFDLAANAVPTRLYYSLCLAQGEGGLWNPFLFRGYDHLGVAETGAYHPLHWLIYRFLPAEIGLAVECVLIVPIAFVGMWLLLRSWRLLPGAALFGASLLVVSTFFMAHFGQIHMVWIYGHLPWVLLAVDCCFRGRRRAAAAGGLGLAYASMLLLCHPQVVFLVSLPAAALTLYRWHAGRRGVLDFRPLLLPLCGVVCGVLIGMLQLLPTLAALADSGRGDLSALQRQNFSLHPLQLLPNLAPAVFAEKTLGDLHYGIDDAPRFANNITEYSAYFGVALLTLVWCGLMAYWEEVHARRHRALRITILVTGSVGGLLMLGRYGGLNALLGYLPLVSQFRSPDRYKTVVAVVLIVLAVLTIDRMLRSPPQLTGLRRRLLWLPLLLTSATAGALATTDHLTFRGVEIALCSWPALLWGPGVAAAVTACFIGARRTSRWPVLIAVICVADLAIYGLPIVLDVPYRTMAEVRNAREAMAPRPRPYRHIALDNQPLWQGYYLATGYMGMVPREYFDYARLEHLQLASVSDGHVNPNTVAAIPSPLPRLRLATELRHVSEPLRDTDKVDLRRVVLCAPGVGEALTGPPLAAGEGVETVYDGFDRIEVQTRVAQPRILVCSDAWHAGWQARVDGVSRAVLPLFGGAMRGVIVQPGETQVVLAYEPAYLQPSRRLAGLGLGGCLLLIVAGWRRRHGGAEALDTVDEERRIAQGHNEVGAASVEQQENEDHA